MISKATLRKLIDDVQSEFEKCWTVLRTMKDGPLSDLSADDFFAFQPTLASALFRLDEMYLSLCQEHKGIIDRKDSLSPNWLRHRLKTIAAYQTVLNEVIALGRALGDSFAWAFYQNDRQYLDKHFAHEEVTHTPPGIGGQGELEFVRRVRDIKGQFVIYHGVTTFLRLGDISLIDLKTQTVTAIGDLKTISSGPAELDISLYFFGPHVAERIPLDTSADSRVKPEPSLTPKMKSKWENQFKRMVESFSVPKADRTLKVHTSFQLDALERVASALEAISVVYEKAGDGLMLVGTKSWRTNSLSSSLLGHSVPDLDKHFGEVVSQAKQLIDMEQAKSPKNANSIFIGRLTTAMLIGTIPIFWWPVQTAFLRKLFFREAFVLTLYNPAHLIKKLRALGYEVELVDDGRRHKVSRLVGSGKIEVSGMGHFESLVKDYLMSEDAVVAIFSDVLEQATAGDMRLGSGIILAIHQDFRAPKTES